MNIFEKLGAHFLLLIILILVYINIGFLLGYEISSLTLPICYIIYLCGYFLFKLIKKEKIKKLHFLLALLFPLLFLASTYFFGKTFDGSYDGQDYHSGAVIELARGWNPWQSLELPFKLPDANFYVKGYPKALWFIQTSIYTLTDKLNSATVTNLFIVLISSIFVYGALMRVQTSRAWALSLTPIVILEPNFLQQFFTFMADGFSYQVALIALSSLIMLIVDKKKFFPLTTFFSALILLAGTKFSNLIIFGILGVLCIVYILRIIRKNLNLIPIVTLFILISAITLWIPYGKNYITYNSAIYPSNQAFAKNDLASQNIPQNIKTASRHELLFYGIYSKSQEASTAENPNNVATLKIPFTTSLNEITTTNNYNGRVGSEGVLFSGIFSLGIILYIFSIFKYKNVYKNYKHFLLITFTLTVSVFTSLLNPTPNVLRYVPLIYFMPIFILHTYVISKLYTQSKTIKIICIIFTILFTLNIALKFLPTLYARDQEMKAQNYLLTSMRESNHVYQVYSESFYSSYIILEEHGVKFVKSKRLVCKNPQSMWIMFTTYYCPL